MVRRVAGGRAWYQVLDRNGRELSAGWQRIAWRGQWTPAGKPIKADKRRKGYQTKG
jgi:hypothetical protein